MGLVAFSYYGSKNRAVPWLLSMTPPPRELRGAVCWVVGIFTQ